MGISNRSKKLQRNSINTFFFFSSYKMKSRTARRKCRRKRQRRQLKKKNSTLNTKQLYISLVTYLLEKGFDVARDYMLAN